MRKTAIHVDFACAGAYSSACVERSLPHYHLHAWNVLYHHYQQRSTKARRPRDRGARQGMRTNEGRGEDVKGRLSHTISSAAQRPAGHAIEAGDTVAPVKFGNR